MISTDLAGSGLAEEKKKDDIAKLSSATSSSALPSMLILEFIEGLASISFSR